LEKKVFLREATGLVRELSFFDVMAVATMNMSIGMGSLYLLLYGPATAPGGDLVVGTIICFALAIFGGLSWAFIGSVMPRSGGDYVFLSRVMHPALGTATSSVWYAVNVLWGGMSAAWVASTGIPTLAYSIGRPDIAAMATTPPVLIAVGTVVLVFSLILLVFSLRAWLIFQGINFAIGMVMLLALLAVVASATRAQFISSFNAFSATYGSPDYNTILSIGAEEGYSWTPSASATIAIIPAAYWALGYAYAGTFFSGEIKRTSKNIPLGIVSGLLITGFFMALTAAIFVHVMGYEFLGSATAAWYAGKWTVPNPPYFQVLAGTLVMNNPPLLMLFGIGMICWNLLWPGLGLWGMSRITMAWSFDRLVPSWFGAVSDRFHTPHVSLIFAFITNEIVLIIYAFYYQFLASFTSEVMQTATTFMLIGIAATILPFTRKMRKLYEGSTVSKYKIGSIPLITISGLLYVVWLLTVLYFFVGPAYGELHMSALVQTSSVFVAAFILWFVVRAYRRKQGIDIDLAYKELPPE